MPKDDWITWTDARGRMATLDFDGKDVFLGLRSGGHIHITKEDATEIILFLEEAFKDA